MPPVLPGSDAASGTHVPLGAARLRRALRRGQDEAVLERAVAGGLLDPEALEHVRALVEAGDDRPLSEILVTMGALTSDALARLEKELAEEEFARPRASAAAPREVQEALTRPERILDEFVLLELLGRGGSGEVWRAWDGPLARMVAVKLSTASMDAGQAHLRFEREALATARLGHPHIVPVFKAGSAGGRPYLVMPFIEGETLDRVTARERLPLDRALEVVRVVAEATEYAHARGIVHRDLKPGNIMIDREGRPVVLDFGLAFLRAETSSRLTRPGELLGTASFMAPEQASGEAASADVTVDVYGLGATLYFLLTGRAPFVGESFAAVVAQVISQDPTPLRRLRSELSREIEAVVQKAMDKHPDRRYPTPAAFAAELGRLAAAQPIEARASSRLARWVRRQPAVVLAASAIALVGVAATATAVRARRQAANDSAAAAGALRDLARVSLDTALRLRRAGDVTGMRQTLPRVSAAYTQVAARGLQTAEIEYLMGRMHRALLDTPEALGHQERALTLDSSYAPALYERAVLLSRRYGAELGHAQGAAQTEGRKRSIAEIETAHAELERLRSRILADAESLAALPLGEARPQAVRGILAHHRRRYDEARALLEQALRADPDMEEAWETLAQTESAARRPERAVAAYEAGIARDRGYLPFYVGLCDLARSGNAAEALASVDRALALDPESMDARRCRVDVLIARAHDALMSGEDPLADLDRAITDLTTMAARRQSARDQWNLAVAHRYRAVFLGRRGRDPLPAFVASEAAAERAIELGPTRSEFLACRGRTRAWRAQYLNRQGRTREANADVAGAMADYDRAAALDGREMAAVMWRADLRARQATFDLDAGGAPLAAFEQAEREFARVEDVMGREEDGWFLLLRGGMRIQAGRCRARLGGDPLPDWRQAEQDLDRALQIFPRHVAPALERGRLSLERAVYQASHAAQAAHATHASRGPRAPEVRAELAIASQHLDRVLEREPTNREALALRTRLRAL